MTLPTKVRFGLLLAGGVLLSGFADFAATNAGYERLGVAVWVFGYLGTMLLIWYLWLRPLDLTGPT